MNQKPIQMQTQDYKEPLALSIKYELSSEFVSKVNSESDCKIIKVIEIITCKVLQYWIECPKEKENLITDYGFMTWIKNPVFQKYYHGTKAFTEIAEKYLSERLNEAATTLTPTQ